MSTVENHDQLLFSMMESCKNLPTFFDHIFGFLNRKTDFYQIATDVNAPVGLPPGLAEKFVKQAFLKWKPQPKHIPEETELPQRREVCTKPPQTEHFTNADSYNGAVYDNYSWSQNLREVDVAVNVPEHVKSKDLLVQIQTGRILVKLKTNNETLLEGELCDKCKHNEAIWSLDKRKLNIHLDKSREIWWNCLVKSEPKLDINTLDCSRPFEELPEEAQAKIEELQWNQERQRQGLPTSDQLHMNSMLKQAWNAPGSPFSGDFDPSTVQFN